MLTRSRPTTEATIAAPQGLPVEPARDTIVEARDLRKVYGAKVAVAGVSFGVRRGEIFGILGPNGAGK
jgi:ABC-type sugar transport system ATPase subunit